MFVVTAPRGLLGLLGGASPSTSNRAADDTESKMEIVSVGEQKQEPTPMNATCCDKQPITHCCTTKQVIVAPSTAYQSTSLAFSLTRKKCDFALLITDFR